MARSKPKSASISIKTTSSPANGSMESISGAQTGGIVELVGPFNLDLWNQSLLANLGDLQPFVTHKPAKPTKPGKAKGQKARDAWKRDRRKAKKLVSRSLARVSQLLQVGGAPNTMTMERGERTPSAGVRRDHRSPHKIYKSALHAMRILADSNRTTTTLFRQLCTIQRSSFQSLAAYQNRIQDLRRQLSLLECDPGDRFMVFLALGGLDKSPFAVQDRMLREVFAAGELPPVTAQAPTNSSTKSKKKQVLAMGTVAEDGSAWNKLMEQFSTRAIKERYTPIPQSSPGEQDAEAQKNDLDSPATP
ncbi:hypothetical protein RB595_004344 [Gaeumannomyces hyphopodioides]